MLIIFVIFESLKIILKHKNLQKVSLRFILKGWAIWTRNEMDGWIERERAREREGVYANDIFRTFSWLYMPSDRTDDTPLTCLINQFVNFCQFV